MSNHLQKASTDLQQAVEEFEQLQFSTEASQLSGYELLIATVQSVVNYVRGIEDETTDPPDEPPPAAP